MSPCSKQRWALLLQGHRLRTLPRAAETGGSPSQPARHQWTPGSSFPPHQKPGRRGQGSEGRFKYHCQLRLKRPLLIATSHSNRRSPRDGASHRGPPGTTAPAEQGLTETAPWGWYLPGGITEQPEKQEMAERLRAQAWSQATGGCMSALPLPASLSPSSMTQRKCCLRVTESIPSSTQPWLRVSLGQ